MSDKKGDYKHAQKHSRQPQENVAEEKATPRVALLVVDVLNDLDFEGNEYIVEQSKKIAGTIHSVAAECRKREIPIIYCNDNWGEWNSDKQEIIDHTTAEESNGKEMSRKLVPLKGDYFVIKPKHSAFFSTSLDVLLVHLDVRTLMIVGVAGNICILFTANDAYMRDYALVIPPDCIASNTPEEDEAALHIMKEVLKAEVVKSDKLEWDKIIEAAQDAGDAGPEKPRKKGKKGAMHKAKE